MPQAQLGVGDLGTQNCSTDLVTKCLLGGYHGPGTLLGAAEKPGAGGGGSRSLNSSWGSKGRPGGVAGAE